MNKNIILLCCMIGSLLIITFLFYLPLFEVKAGLKDVDPTIRVNKKQDSIATFFIWKVSTAPGSSIFFDLKIQFKNNDTVLNNKDKKELAIYKTHLNLTVDTVVISFSASNNKKDLENLASRVSALKESLISTNDSNTLIYFVPYDTLFSENKIKIYPIPQKYLVRINSHSTDAYEKIATKFDSQIGKQIIPSIIKQAPSVEYEPFVISLLNGAVAFCIMILGMFCNQATEFIKKEKTLTIIPKQIFYDSLKGKSFWIALLVSPIVFFTLPLLKIEVSPRLVFCSSFQNGFFWQAIVGSVASGFSKDTQTMKDIEEHNKGDRQSVLKE